MTNLHDHWAQVGVTLRGLLTSTPALPEADRLLILDYLAHNELGLALEALCSALKIGAVAITPPQYEVIVRVQTAMKMSGVAESVSHLVRQ